jgi:sugar diacid utilization regulator
LDEPNAERALRHALALGCELDARYRAVILEPQGAGITTALASVRRVAREMRIDASLAAPRETTLLVFLGPQVDWTIFCEHLAREWRVEHRVGVGELHGVEELGASIKEASLALRLRRHRVASFHDLGLLGRVLSETDANRLASTVSQWIGVLVDYDSVHKSDLVGTLRVFLGNNGAIDSTARTLHVHSNTLKYRLRRIAELTHRDLRDADDRLNLDFACRALESRDLLPVQPSVGESLRPIEWS